MLTQQCVFQRETIIADALQGCTSGNTVQLQSYIMHQCLQVGLTFIDTLHLCKNCKETKF